MIDIKVDNDNNQLKVREMFDEGREKFVFYHDDKNFLV
jgi:hypothetical protein